MHHDGTSRNQATHVYSHFFVSNLKNKVMDASGARITVSANEENGQKTCFP